MKSTRRLAVAVGVLAVLAACSRSKDIAETPPSSSSPGSHTSTGSPAPTTPSGSPMSSSPTTSSPRADRLQGHGYSVAIPAGWENLTSSLKGQNPSVDVAMGESRPSGFRTNFNVVLSPHDPGSIASNKAAIRAEAARELRQITHTTVRPLPDRAIDGAAAIGQTSTFVSSGTSVTFLQYFTEHAGRAYPITMTFASEHRTDAARTLDDILASWQWGS